MVQTGTKLTESLDTLATVSIAKSVDVSSSLTNFMSSPWAVCHRISRSVLT